MANFGGTRTRGRRDDVIAGLVVAIGIALFALPQGAQASLRRVVRATVLAPFLSAQSTLVRQRARREDVETLRIQRDSLLMVLTASRPLAEENQRLRALMGLHERGGDAFVPADVIRVGLASSQGVFMVDVGRSRGIRVGSPVITADGLLGMVETVDLHSAQAIDWTHPEFRASAMSVDGTVYGLVQARRGEAGEGTSLVLTGASFHSDLRPGTRIVTSGRGALLPRGIPLGTVIGIDDADTGWRKSYILRPAVRPEAAVHVLIGEPEDSSSRADYSRLWQTLFSHDAAPVDAGSGGHP